MIVWQATSLLLPILISGIGFILSIKRGWLEALNRPMDFGASWRGRRIFGDNKNWRGAAFYIFGGTLLTGLLHLAQPSQSWISPLYQHEPLSLGLATTSAYVAGELVNSFVKRQANVAPGGATSSRFGSVVQRFFDNVDGALASGFVLIAYGVEWRVLTVSFGLSYMVHTSTDVWMRWLKLKR